MGKEVILLKWLLGVFSFVFGLKYSKLILNIGKILFSPPTEVASFITYEKCYLFTYIAFARSKSSILTSLILIMIL